jgi:hypothetical protein
MLFPPAVLVFCALLILNLVIFLRPNSVKTYYLSRENDSPVVWVLIWLSFFVVTSLHKFFLLNPAGLIHDITERGGEFMLSANTLLNILGLISVPLIYYFRHRFNPTFSLLLLSSVLLIPNDDCQNLFNTVWLNKGLFSPMMFVPNVAAILFSLPMLRNGINIISLLVVIATLTCTLLLGLGHLTAYIW